jgi:hypothetical protein
MLLRLMCLRSISGTLRALVRGRLLAKASGTLLAGSPLLGQAPDSARTSSAHAAPLILLGSPAEDRLRLAQNRGYASTAGMMIRSASVLTAPLAGARTPLRWMLVPPVVEATWNSALPFSLNDGAVWAGRGLSTRLMAGARAQFGRVSVTVAPELIHVQNQDFQILPSPAPNRSAFASPWHSGGRSADLPLRFGNQPYTMLVPGQTTIALRVRAMVVGASTEDQWWGPGIRNALVMSNNAAGIPHVFARTSAPIRTRVGHLEAKWLVGGLTESPYFDRDGSNDLRAISAFAATLQPAAEPDLTLGITRAVYRPVGDGLEVPEKLLNVFTFWNSADDTTESRRAGQAEQLMSLFARWLLPASGAEVYAEWARTLPPKGLRDLLVAPHRTQAYTIGMQWATAVRGTALVRVQSELTTLEQTRPPAPGAEAPTYYASPLVPQGYTQRGQVIGAAIGPGSSSQWLGADYLARHWRLGVTAGRIRWEDEAYYRQPTGFSSLAHDVSIWAGIRAGVRVRDNEVGAELLSGHRFNYLFQNPYGGYISDTTFDARNLTLRLYVAPGWLPWRRGAGAGRASRADGPLVP